MIGGNTKALLQMKSTGCKNSIGERADGWKESNSITLYGWLDLATGDSRHDAYSAKVQESSHIFMCDYVDLKSELQAPKVTAENCRMVIDGEVYEVSLIDDPMNLHEHFEIYLKYTGGQSG